MGNLPDDLTRLKERLERLERRVTALEDDAAQKTVNLPSTLPDLPLAQLATPVAADRTALSVQRDGVLAVMGKSMLGIAGGFLLRALAESGSFPKLAVVTLAFVYAGLWLASAARSSLRKIACTLYAATSALLLAPMLWELTLRFGVLSPATAAMVLAVYIAAASTLAWQRNLIALLWVVDASAALTALALMIATRDPMPFLATLLLMALICESAAASNHWLRVVRPTAAMAADLAICVLMFVYDRPESFRADYKEIPAAWLMLPAATLLLIYGVSFVYRTVLRRERVSSLWIGQTMLTFLLAAICTFDFGADTGRLVLGICCLVFSMAGYTAIFFRFRSPTEQRNLHVYAAWSVALLLGGGWLALSPLWHSLVLCMAAIAATLLTHRTNPLMLKFHGLLYLVIASSYSGLLAYIGHALIGKMPAAPGWIVWMVSATAILCYAADIGEKAAQWPQRIARLIAASLAVGVLATLLVAALVWMASIALAPGTTLLAVLRTMTGCGLALALAFAGSRWMRVELVWTAYGAMIVGALKLIFEDLRLSSASGIAIAIFLYAITLILLPRLVRIGQRQ